MKKIYIALYCVLILCAGCTAQTPSASATPTAPSGTAPQASTQPEPSAAVGQADPAETGQVATPAAFSGIDFSNIKAPQIPLDQYPVVDGSTATIPLGVAMMQCATGIPAEQADQLVYHSTTDTSYNNLITNNADLLIVYAPSAQTQALITESGIPLDMQPIGRDALVFLTNADNPVTGLTGQQIVSIYSGETKNWSEVGGGDAEIQAFQRPDLSGSQTLMKKLVMQEVPLMEAPSDKIPEDMGGLVDVVREYTNSANALGYSVYYYVNNMYAQPDIKLLSVDGVMPSNETIQSGEYPYINEFYAVIKSGDKTGPARELFDWLTGADGQALISAAGYVPVK